MTALASEPDSRRSVMGRLFDILDCFAGREPLQNVASLCEQTGIPQATVHRMLATLMEWGAIEREGRGQYKLGMRMWRLGWGVPEASELRDLARPHLVDLYSVLQAPVARCVRDGSDVRVVDQIAGHAQVHAQVHGPASSRRFPLGASAAGLVLLANLPLADLRRCAEDPAVRLNPELVKSEFVLLQKMAELRKHRLAVTKRRDGAASIAAPVFDGEGTLRFAISAEVPAARVNLPQQCAAVSRAAMAISAELGARARHDASIG